MVTLIIKRNDGTTTEIENVIAWDCFTKDLCEDIAGRELTDQELFDIEDAMDGESEVTSDILRVDVLEVIRESND